MATAISASTGSNFDVTRNFLINYEVFLEGERFLGTADVELPDFKFSTAEVKGPGILGTIDMPGLGHTDSLELTLNWRTINGDLIKLAEQRAIDMTIRGSNQNYNQSNKKLATEPVRVDFRGVPKQTTLGSFKPVEATESKSVFEVIVLHLYVGGVMKIKYDKVNYIMDINGTDYLASFRSDLGLDIPYSSVTVK